MCEHVIIFWQKYYIDIIFQEYYDKNISNTAINVLIFCYETSADGTLFNLNIALDKEGMIDGLGGKLNKIIYILQNI